MKRPEQALKIKRKGRKGSKKGSFQTEMSFNIFSNS